MAEFAASSAATPATVEFTGNGDPACSAGASPKPKASLKSRFKALLLSEARKKWNSELSDLGDGCVAPFRVTPQHTIDRVVKELHLTNDDVVYDLGCGEGHWCIAATLSCGCRSVGIELSEEIAQRARERARKAGALQVNIVVRDMMAPEGLNGVEEATVVVVYMGREASRRLSPQLQNILRPGTKVVSVHFAIPGWEPVKVDTGETARVYHYIIPSKSGHKNVEELNTAKADKN